MKKIHLLAFVLILSVQGFSQEKTNDYDYYMNKSRTQKTAAWVVAGSGILMMTAGVMIGPDTKELNDWDDLFSLKTYLSGGGTLIVIGGLTTIASIPLFLASKRNKRTAMLLEVTGQKTPVIQKGSFVNKSFPAISLKINL